MQVLHTNLWIFLDIRGIHYMLKFIDYFFLADYDDEDFKGRIKDITIFKRSEMAPMNLGVEMERIADFCRRWKINRLAIFGSAVRGELRPGSDIDLLVTFRSDADWTMFDHFTMEEELSRLLGREVDLISVRAVEENPNPITRREILDSARQIYAA